jgi:hypothetical protein
VTLPFPSPPALGRHAAPIGRGPADLACRWLGGKRILILAAVAMVAAGAWFGWPWLAAAGIAPILLSLAPCAVMCAVGVCTMKACSKPGSGVPAGSIPTPVPTTGDSTP